MEEREIIKRNKLIAEFMGAAIELWEVKDGLGEDTSSDALYCYFPEGDVCSPEDLKYHSDWDCLMPVVEKIEQIHEGVPQELIHLSLFNTKDEVYNAIIKFIKRYNKNK